MHPALAPGDVHQHPRIAFLLGTEGVVESSGALVAKVVLAAVPGAVPPAALQQYDREARLRQLLGYEAAAGARAHYHRVYPFERHTVTLSS